MVYVICFLISSLFFWLSEKQQKSTLFFASIAIFIPCFLAGIRANSVGTDVSVYLEPMILNAKSAQSFQNYLLSSWQQGWVVRGVNDIEIGFSVLVYLIIKMFNSRHVLQFVIQALTIIPIYIGLVERKEKNLWIGMFVYFCFFYNISLNIMRQAIAMSFVFCAFQYLIEKKNVQFWIIMFSACLFHTTALIGFVLYFIYEYLELRIFNKSKRIQQTKKRTYFLLIAGMLILVAQSYIAKLFETVGLTYYVHYFEGAIEFLPNQIISRLPILLACIFLSKQLIKNLGNEFYFYICCVVYAIIFSQFASANSSTYRIAMYFSIFFIKLVPEICACSSRFRFSKNKVLRMNRYFMISYCIVWWIYYCLIMIDSSIPYKTDLFI